MQDHKPDPVASSRSGIARIGGVAFSVGIRRMSNESLRTPEAEGPEGISHVRDDQFAAPAEAWDAAVGASEAEGPAAFMRGEEAVDVIPFPRG